MIDIATPMHVGSGVQSFNYRTPWLRFIVSRESPTTDYKVSNPFNKPGDVITNEGWSITTIIARIVLLPEYNEYFDDHFI